MNWFPQDHPGRQAPDDQWMARICHAESRLGAQSGALKRDLFGDDE